MKYIGFFIALLLTQNIFATFKEHKLELADDALTYYTVTPKESSHPSYPLLLVLDGSFCEDRGPSSFKKVVTHEDYFLPLSSLGIAL